MANSFYELSQKVIDNVVNREDIDNLFDTAESIDELQTAEDFERRVDILDEFTSQEFTEASQRMYRIEVFSNQNY